MYITDFNNYCKDVVQHVSAIKSKHQNVPFFIIGYSMVSTLQILECGLILSRARMKKLRFPKLVLLGQMGIILITLGVPSTYTQILWVPLTLQNLCSSGHHIESVIVVLPSRPVD